MQRLLICSLNDVPSVNMKKMLMNGGGWDHLGSDGKNEYHGNGDMVIMTIPELHIYAESVDREAEAFGIHAEEVIFMSRHKAASGIPTLTVHPIGNYNDADFGGRSRSLVPAASATMTDALRRLSGKDTKGFEVSFEVTHHGPWLDRPTFFIEIGSDESSWGNLDAAKVLAEVIREVEGNDHPNVIGMGGGHYAPRFTEVAKGFEINFGHMLPSYAYQNSSDDEIVRMVGNAAEATHTKMIYLHRKSMKKPEAARISGLLESNGFEIISSKDLNPIGNR